MATERVLAPDRRAVLRRDQDAVRASAARLLGGAEARVALLIVAWKLLAFLVVVEGYRSVPLDEEEWRRNLVYPPSEAPTFQTTFTGWDASHYLFLADEGYGKSAASDAFPPLFPLSIRALNFVTGDGVVSGLLLANLASGAGLFVFFLFARRRFGEATAWRALLLFLAFPTAFYLNLIYSEGPFLLLTAAFFYLLYRRQLALAAVAAFLLPLTRVVGVFVAAPLAAFLLADAWSSRQPAEKWSRALQARLLWALAPLAGLGAYMLYMRLTTGEVLAQFQAVGLYQSDWSIRHVFEPDILLRHLLAKDLSIVHTYWDRLAFLGFVAALPLIYRRVDRPLFLFCLLMGMVPLLGSFMSYTRYLALAVPMYIAFGSWFEAGGAWRRGPVFVCALCGLGLVQAAFLVFHTRYYWVA